MRAGSCERVTDWRSEAWLHCERVLKCLLQAGLGGCGARTTFILTIGGTISILPRWRTSVRESQWNVIPTFLAGPRAKHVGGRRP